MYDQSDFILISAIQHYQFCKRQCALIHIENIWIENRFIIEGKLLHIKAHTLQSEKRKNVLYQFNLPISSYKLGIVGKCDLVEFHYSNSKDKLLKKVVPVEYKRGKMKADDWDILQLCSQAMSLEEMTNIAIPFGYIYYHKVKHRVMIDFDTSLRNRTTKKIEEIRLFLNEMITPIGQYSSKCKRCSLFSVCMPKVTAKKHGVLTYLKKSLMDMKE